MSQLHSKFRIFSFKIQKTPKFYQECPIVHVNTVVLSYFSIAYSFCWKRSDPAMCQDLMIQR